VTTGAAEQGLAGVLRRTPTHVTLFSYGVTTGQKNLLWCGMVFSFSLAFHFFLLASAESILGTLMLKVGSLFFFFCDFFLFFSDRNGEFRTLAKVFYERKKQRGEVHPNRLTCSLVCFFLFCSLACLLPPCCPSAIGNQPGDKRMGRIFNGAGVCKRKATGLVTYERLVILTCPAIRSYLHT